MDNKELSELKELIKIRKQIASGELKVAQHNIDAYRKKRSTLHTIELPNGKNIKLDEIELKAIKRKK